MTVVQLTGAHPGGVEENAVEIVRRMASIARGPAYPIYAPLVVNDVATARSLRNQPQIADAMKRYRDLTKAIVPIGSWEPTASLVLASLPKSEGAALRKRGVRAEVCARLMDDDGNPLEDLADRVIAITLEELRRVPEVVAVATGAEGLVLLPYLDGERTPNLPHAAGSLHGLRRHTMTPENLARAAVEGMLCGLADGLDALRRIGVTARRILLVGGGARSAAIRAVAPTVFGAPVHVPAPGEYVALGAARQAAWVLAGGTTPPQWRAETWSVIDNGDEEVGAAVRARYAAIRNALHRT